MNSQLPSCVGLHNDVDIKIGIIYKNRKNQQNCLKNIGFWSIVFMHCFYLRLFAPFWGGFFTAITTLCLQNT